MSTARAGLWIGLGLAFAGLAACSPAPAEPSAPAEVTPLEIPEPAKAPAADSFYTPILERMDGELARLVTDGQVANVAYTLVKDGETVRTGAFGTRTLDGPDPVDAHTIYRIYSMTKPVTAVAMMMLVEDGKIRLDDPITNYVPELAGMKVVRAYGVADTAGIHDASRPATIRELLTHTAGFGYGDGRQDYVNRQIQAQRVADAPTNRDYLARLASVPLMYEPGTAWAYSAASDVQGIIVERVSGERLGEFMKRRIFDPLGMVDTAFSVSEAQRPRLAAFTAWTPEEPIHALAGPVATMEAAGLPRDAGGHGLVSTIADYQRFAEMLLNDGTLGDVTLLKPETVALMRTNALSFTNPDSGQPMYEPMRGVGYGFGMAVVTDTIRSGLGAPAGTYFWDGAAGTWFWIDPRDRIIFIGMLQNLSTSQVQARPLAMRNVYHSHFSDYDPTSEGGESASGN
ncbi:MAG: beta-lactamase family protein [Hyphomonas sp.]|nr:beta-lactamase family protein [Hyphomonas sp.]